MRCWSTSCIKGDGVWRWGFSTSIPGRRRRWQAHRQEVARAHPCPDDVHKATITAASATTRVCIGFDKDSRRVSGDVAPGRRNRTNI